MKYRYPGLRDDKTAAGTIRWRVRVKGNQTRRSGSLLAQANRASKSIIAQHAVARSLKSRRSSNRKLGRSMTWPLSMASTLMTS